MIHHLGRYGRVLGIDNNPKPLKIAHQRGYEARLASAEEMPFPDQGFDLVAALDVIEHCEDDLLVLRQCYRVCAPGGSWWPPFPPSAGSGAPTTRSINTTGAIPKRTS